MQILLEDFNLRRAFIPLVLFCKTWSVLDGRGSFILTVLAWLCYTAISMLCYCWESFSYDTFKYLRQGKIFLFVRLFNIGQGKKTSSFLLPGSLF